jgi:dihydrofolate reductase
MTLEDVGPDNWRHCAALEVEMTLFTVPVVVGQGTRLFPDTGPDTALDPVDSRSTPKGNDPGLPGRRAPAVRNGHA